MKSSIRFNYATALDVEGVDKKLMSKLPDRESKDNGCIPVLVAGFSRHFLCHRLQPVVDDLVQAGRLVEELLVAAVLAPKVASADRYPLRVCHDNDVTV